MLNGFHSTYLWFDVLFICGLDLILNDVYYHIICLLNQLICLKFVFVIVCVVGEVFVFSEGKP